MEMSVPSLMRLNGCPAQYRARSGHVEERRNRTMARELLSIFDVIELPQCAYTMGTGTSGVVS